MSDDLISRQAAIDAIAGCTNCGDEEQLRKYVVKHGLENGWTGGVLDALDAIQDLPPAQTEIIYCKDCIHYSKHKDDYMCGVNVLAYVRETDYCSRAERRINELGDS